MLTVGVLLMALLALGCQTPAGPSINIFNTNQASNGQAGSHETTPPNPATAEVEVNVLGGTKPDGKELPAGTFSGGVGTVLLLDATPLDVNHQPLNTHGPMQGWRTECTPSEAMAFEGDTGGFNPSLRIRLSPSSCRIFAKVDGKEGTAVFSGTP
jgi:hypothetical protein